MRTSVIQADAALPGAPSQSVSPFQSAGQGATNFAQILQRAERSGSSAPVRSQAEATPVTGRGKSTEKDAAKNSKAPALRQAMLAIKSFPAEDAKPVFGLAANLEMMPPPANITAAPAAQSSIPPSEVNSQSLTTSGLAPGADSAKQGASVKSANPAQKDASTPETATVFDYGLGGAGLEAGKQLPVAGSAPPSNVEAQSGETRVGPDEGEPLAPALTPERMIEASLASQSSSAALPLDLVGLDAHAQTLSSSSAELAGIVDHGGPSFLAAAISSKMPNSPDSTSAANVASELNKSTPDSKPRADSGDPRPFPAGPISAGSTLQVVDPSSRESAAEPITRSGSNRNLQPGDGSSHEPKLTSAPAVASSYFSTEILKPILLPTMTGMRGDETLFPSNAHEREASAGRVLSNPEHAPSKPADSASSSDLNAQPALRSVAVPASTSPASAGEQPSSAIATANVLARDSAAANQDSESRSAGLPTAEHQSPTANSPNPSPAAGTVEVARLVAGAAQSEMHIGLRTQAFGSVEVHTIVRDSQLGLTVGSERGDLRTLLAPEFSDLQTTFHQHDLRLDNIRFLETSAGTTAGFSGGAHSQARSPSQQHSVPAMPFSIQGKQENPTELDVSPGSRARLNVHA